mmetsp:Transcript_18210/g.37546  ORF Transcript_18210/g.37546 Transcript_18210/m.37546 type:complete len:172 (-) Transcript_18210:163-678(-)|eukprot:CAMPEP_0197269798 /NCGR_PEP_ID=MMETSP1432-20130617/6106_1 /TAXON_ID=44447 /ORGANISM="Pseudo-nitzschia delicatissima, Strain UNC1205" /LENGTH=171 /DNA_ID=CAMNT_0042735009 /DNA_START=41 /DNA_END=556 /DNA_ORIENTATION=-
MMPRTRTIAFSSLLLLVSTSAFSASRAPRPLKPSVSSSSLNVGAVWDNENSAEGSVLWMARATSCVNSDTCDLEEAETCLEGLSRINISNMAIEKASAVSQVVANLRSKLLANTENEKEAEAISPFQATMGAMNVVAGMYVAYAVLHDCSAGSSIPFDDSVLSCFDAYSML